jgi:uncharacterized membrane protein
MKEYLKVSVVSWTRIIVVVFHIVGLIGMKIPSLLPIFQLLTPFHLLVCTTVLLVFHRDWNKNFILFLILSISLGFLSEVLGVKTGFPFGNYYYSEVLGLQLWEVPLIIGVNWFLLVYITGALFHEKKPFFLAAILGAALLVLIDVLIEPVAVKLNFWQWEDDEIPLSNYIGWFGVAFILQCFYHGLNFQKENPMSDVLIISLIVFFAALNFIL